MDTVKFLKTINRMCKSYDSSCNGCPISIEIQRSGDYLDCYGFIKLNIEKVVEVVEKWDKEHLVKTRKSALLEIFPNVPLDSDGVLRLCPQEVEEEMACFYTCQECCKRFWEEELNNERR